jgi:predicted Zn-dependent protease
MKKSVLILCLAAIPFLLFAQQGGNNGFGGLGGLGDVGGALSGLDSAIATENDAEMTPEEEYYLGRAVAANILKFYKPYTANQVLTNYLNKICSAITVNSPQPELYNGYHVMMLDTKEINAFATPGGHIFVSRGLVETVTSEDQLAAVIAHEVSHIILQHGVSIIRSMKFTQSLTDAGNAAAGTAARNAGLNGRVQNFGSAVMELTNDMVKSGYSQAQEFEADNVALILLASAGYDPKAMAEMLQLLDNAEKAQKVQLGGWFSTHPSPAMRLSNVQRNVNRYNIPDTRSHRQSRFKNK